MKLSLKYFLWVFLLALAPATQARVSSPFTLTATLDTNAIPTVRFAFTVPPQHLLYADHLHFLNAKGDELTPSQIPVPVTKIDPVTGHEKKFYNQDFAVQVQPDSPLPARLVVKFQGCSNSACYFPERHDFLINAGTVAAVAPPKDPETSPTATSVSEDWVQQRADFNVAARQTGYLGAGEFIKFLGRAKSGEGAPSIDPLASFHQEGILLTLVLILIGGVCLNFTPCVLPLIPINLAIIGAGKAAKSRWRASCMGACMARAWR